MDDCHPKNGWILCDLPLPDLVDIELDGAGNS